MDGAVQKRGAGDRPLRPAGRDPRVPVPHGSGITLFRYWRLCETYDAPVEQREVVSQMVAEVLRHDPLYAAVLQDPLPLEETPEYAAFQALPRAGSSDREFRAEFDRELDGRVSRLVDWKGNNEEILASSVREVLGVPRSALSDSEAIVLVLDPARNRTLGETLTLRRTKLSRAMFHPSYTFRKKLSHTPKPASSPHDARSRPRGRLSLGGTDYVVPILLADVRKRSSSTSRRCATRGTRHELRSRGVSDEFAAYLLPNAVAIRFTESADLLNCPTSSRCALLQRAGGDRALLDEALQIRGSPPHRAVSSRRARCDTTRRPTVCRRSRSVASSCGHGRGGLRPGAVKKEAGAVHRRTCTRSFFFRSRRADGDSVPLAGARGETVPRGVVRRHA